MELKTKFIKLNNLSISPTGDVFIAGRQIYPDKEGKFPKEKHGEYTKLEEILELLPSEDAAKNLKAQVKHSNLSLQQLADWKRNFKKDDKKTWY